VVRVEFQNREGNNNWCDALRLKRVRMDRVDGGFVDCIFYRHMTHTGSGLIVGIGSGLIDKIKLSKR